MAQIKGKVLLTGASGLIGFRTLLDLLDASYLVKAISRSPSKCEELTRHPKLKAHVEAKKVVFITVVDFAAPGAWDEALKDVQYVLHLASPVPYPELNPMTDIYDPIVKDNDNLFDAALKAPNLKRIVLTSSIVAVMPFALDRGPGPYNADSIFVPPPGPYADVYSAYQAAKAHVLAKSKRIVEDSKPSFDIVNILPGYTFGRNERVLKAKDTFTSSNNLLMLLLTGFRFPFPVPSGAAHLDDVARVHVQALSPTVKGNRSLGVSVPVKFNDALVFAKKHFPEAFEKDVFVPGDQPTEEVVWDATATEKELRIKFKGHEEMVVDVAKQYLELLSQEYSAEA